MSKLKIETKYLIEPKRDTIKKILLNGGYIICCDLKTSRDLSSIQIENVVALQKSFASFDKQALVIYCVSNNPTSDLYSLHDDNAIPILNEKMIDIAIEGMLGGYGLFVLDDGFVDRKNIYGKLGTQHENEIVFKYE